MGGLLMTFTFSIWDMVLVGPLRQLMNFIAQPINPSLPMPWDSSPADASDRTDHTPITHLSTKGLNSALVQPTAHPPQHPQT